MHYGSNLWKKNAIEYLITIVHVVVATSKVGPWAVTWPVLHSDFQVELELMVFEHAKIEVQSSV